MNRFDIGLTVAELTEHSLTSVKIDECQPDGRCGTAGFSDGTYDFLILDADGRDTSPWTRSGWPANAVCSCARP